MANNNQRKTPKFNIFWMYALMILFLVSFYYLYQDGGYAQEVKWTQFENIVSKGGVKSITVYSNKNQAEAVLSDSLAKVVFKDLPADPVSTNKTSAAAPVKISTQIPSADKFDDKIEQWRQDGVFNGEVDYKQASDLSMVFWTFGPIVLLVGLWFFLLRRMGGGAGGGGGIFNVGKSKARLFDKDNDSKVTF